MVAAAETNKTQSPDTRPESLRSVSDVALNYLASASVMLDVVDSFREKLETAKRPNLDPEYIQRNLSSRAETQLSTLDQIDPEISRRTYQQSPRRTSHLAEMAAEILQAVPEVDYGAGIEAANAAQAEATQVLVDQYVAKYKAQPNKPFGLSPNEIQILSDMLTMHPDELEVVHYKFEYLGHGFDQLGVSIEEAEERIELGKQERATASLERKLETKKKRAEADAIHEANLIRHEVKKVHQSANKGAAPEFIDQPYDDLSSRSSWATDRLVRFIGNHPDRRTKEHKNGMAALRQELLRYGIGLTAYEQARAKDKTEDFTRMLKKRGIVTPKSKLGRKPSVEELTTLGTHLLEEMEAKQNREPVAEKIRRLSGRLGGEALALTRIGFGYVDAGMIAANGKLTETYDPDEVSRRLALAREAADDIRTKAAA